MPLVLPIHIVAAAVGLVSGAVALGAAKGRVLHRKSGMVFVCAMVLMCASALVAAVAKSQPTNVIAAVVTGYLVITGMATVRPSATSRRQDVGLMLVALSLGLFMVAAGLVAAASPRGRLFGYPPPPFFLLGSFGLVGAAGDIRIIRSGPLRGAPRLRRHLWRMCMALFIAAASFFSIRSRVAAIFPAPLVTPVARVLPVLLVLAAMFYWLWRVRSRVIPARA